MDKTPKVFLQHILDAIIQIESYLEGFDYDKFLSDKRTQDAVIRQLEIIGEATSNLEEDFRSGYPQIPWREISDFRNVLAHEYWDVDLEIVWKAASQEIQELKNSLSSVVSDIEG